MAWGGPARARAVGQGRGRAALGEDLGHESLAFGDPFDLDGHRVHRIVELSQPVADVAKNDRGYLEWMLREKLNSPDKDEDWIHTLKHHLGIKS